MEKEQYELLYRLELHHWWYEGMRSIMSALLDPVLDNGGNLRVLDAGCGTGGTTAYLQRYGKVTGVDISPEAVRLCHTRGQFPVVQGSLIPLPFANDTFDLVVSFDVIYHRAIGDDVEALREMKRVLKESGRVLIRVPAYEFLRASHDEAVHTRHRYTAGELRRQMTAAGLAVERTTYANTLLFSLAAARRGQQIASHNVKATSDLKEEPRFINSALKAVLFGEAKLLRRLNLPFGLSAWALGKKVV
ncbi:MAG: class I SAM-dependent methyltransferase [Chloroflexi bacterium]|nr:class I SAM-dependent methyltransferase [Chloroflexota bacterium]